MRAMPLPRSLASSSVKRCANRMVYAISLMPTNLYGPGDNYHPENSHVLPALIRRFHEAAESNASNVVCWGTGSPLKFLHVDDLEKPVYLLSIGTQAVELSFLNVGQVDLSIRDLAEAVAKTTSYTGNIHWDSSKPDVPKTMGCQPYGQHGLASAYLWMKGWQIRFSHLDRA